MLIIDFVYDIVFKFSKGSSECSICRQDYITPHYIVHNVGNAATNAKNTDNGLKHDPACADCLEKSLNRISLDFFLNDNVQQIAKDLLGKIK